MTPTEQIERLRELERKATAGPWHAHNTDDEVHMNIFAVTTSIREPWLDGSGENEYADVVALTLLQSPRLACHSSGKWEQDAALIAAARNSLPALLDVASAAEVIYDHHCKSIVGKTKTWSRVNDELHADLHAALARLAEVGNER